MATMWPRELPGSVRQDRKRRAEVRVFNAFVGVLDDSFHVFYSTPWIGIDSQGNEVDGECDFLVAHRDHGILAIEVKGGGISRDPATGQWKSRDAGGFVHRIKDPVRQATTAKHAILAKLKRKPRHIHASHGVIFPDVGTSPGNLGADMPTRIFCCSRQLCSGLADWVSERMSTGKKPGNCQPLGKAGLDELEQLLARRFTLSTTFGATLAEVEGEFRLLEPSQYWILDAIPDIPRALVSGGAGTGKTVVAVEEAVRSARSGARTLLTCHSRPLAESLERSLADVANLTVAGFHSFCGRMADRAGIKVSAGGGDSDLYENVLPNALYEAVEVRPALKQDAIVVDEAQDFRPHWWLAINACLKDGGRLRVFMDSNQTLYGGKKSGIDDLSPVPVRLSHNLRNTKRIHEAASLHYSGPPMVADGPEGVDVSWIDAEGLHAKVAAAREELGRLVTREEVSPGDIAVLANGRTARAAFLEAGGKSGIPMTDAEDAALEEVIVDTVRRFKGLERLAVILVASGEELEHEELAYVAFSRARAYLCVVAGQSEQRWLSGSSE